MISPCLSHLVSLCSTQPSRPEFFTLKKEAYDEVVAKMVPDDILTRVSPRPRARRSLTICVVHDSDHGRTKRIVEDEKAVRPPSGVHLCCNPRLLPHRSHAWTIQFIEEYGASVYERTATR